MNSYNVIGVMSGTSLDGIDIVYVNFKLKDYWRFNLINFKTYPYSNYWQNTLRDINQNPITIIEKIDQNYTKFLANTIKNFINEFSISKIDFVSSHGHTAVHDPSNLLTYQLGNLPIISDYLKLKVICDFRTQDLKYGGQGAPLVPVGEKYLFPEFESLINLGGFANITKNNFNNLIAYDICPVNIILNYISNKAGLNYDDKGELASSGNMNMKLFNYLESLEYYKLESPKSLGIEWVRDKIFNNILKDSTIPIKDLLYTFTYHMATQISKNINSEKQNLFTGGGVYNEFLIRQIKSLSNAEIIIPEAKIIEFKEALIFGFLGVLRDLNINNCYTSVTGASKDHSSGKIFINKV
tara:strand:- start:5873 stop:6934 length:1062 start_codon:yes stop_codon:yes gene_type:complete